MGSTNYGGLDKERRIPGMQIPLKGSRGRYHEDLDLFQDLHKRHIDRTASLLLPVSDDFDDNPQSGNDHSLLQRISSAKKKSGVDFLIENSKHDYDWLKTPPATPLFPSLEMEANVSQLVIQREISKLSSNPIPQSQSQPRLLSQNANSEASKASNGRPKSPILVSKPKAIPFRSITPLQRSTISSIDSKKNVQTTPNNQTRASQTPQTKRIHGVPNNTTKQTNQKQNLSHTEMLTPNLSKSMINNGSETNSKPYQNPRVRTTSPLVRSTLAAQIPDFSDKTPSNLITTADRSTSATRGRPTPSNLITTADRSTSATRGRPITNAASVNQKTEANAKTRRDSCSPSVARGRKVELKQEDNNGGNISSQKKRIQTSNGANVLGSKMVEKVMNARKSAAVDERETKAKPSSFINGSSGLAPRATAKHSLFAEAAPRTVVHKS